MAWPHPFITIDQNQFRHPDAIAGLLDQCSRNGLHLLVPDGAFFEFAKGGQFLETARQSLRLIAPYRELVCAARKLSHMMSDELDHQSECTSLVHARTTAFLRSLLEELQQSKDTALRKLAEGPVAELAPAAIAAWNDHEENKRLIQNLRDALGSTMTPDQINWIRRSPEQRLGEWLSSDEGMRFVFQGLKARGANEETAHKLTRKPSVSAGFISAMAGVAIYWLAFGGLSSATAKMASGDLNDVEYVVVGALSRSLSTTDKRASIICRAVTKAFKARRQLPLPKF